jgi:hypothetical protein
VLLEAQLAPVAEVDEHAEHGEDLSSPAQAVHIESGRACPRSRALLVHRDDLPAVDPAVVVDVIDERSTSVSPKSATKPIAMKRAQETLVSP